MVKQMRKNDLIKKLQEIEGNPEIVLYNSFVDDWQHIKLTPGKLFKTIFHNKDFDKNSNWNVNHYWFSEEQLKPKEKRVIFIEGKSRGIQTWLTGEISY